MLSNNKCVCCSDSSGHPTRSIGRKNTAVKDRDYCDYYHTLKQKTARTILLTVMLLVFYRRCSERGSYITLCRDYSRRGRIRSLILINVNSENGFSRVYLILITSRRSRKFSLFHFDKNISMIAPDHAHVSMFENAVEKIRALHAPSFYPLNLTRRSYELRISPVHSPSRLKYTFYELYFMNLSKCLLTMVSLARPEQFSIRSEKGNFEKERESRATSNFTACLQHPPYPNTRPRSNFRISLRTRNII